MSKKHFIALANYIKLHNDTMGLRGFSSAQIETIGDFCASQNINFKRDRWLAYIARECGPNGGTIKTRTLSDAGTAGL